MHNDAVRFGHGVAHREYLHLNLENVKFRWRGRAAIFLSIIFAVKCLL